MPDTLSRRSLLGFALCAWGFPGHAARRRYVLVRESSEISFGFTLQGTAQTGTVPVLSADIEVDTGSLAASTADVRVDIRDVRTSFIFITQALLSPEVLNAESHPVVRFRSTRVRLGARGRISEGAQIDGNLTLRGVTRPVSLDATLSRPAGSAPDDLDILYVDLAGTIDRRDFGAVGYPQLVEPQVTLDIHAEIRAVA
jgi:polyisoprenoid-binding protein YceI